MQAYMTSYADDPSGRLQREIDSIRRRIDQQLEAVNQKRTVEQQCRADVNAGNGGGMFSLILGIRKSRTEYKLALEKAVADLQSHERVLSDLETTFQELTSPLLPLDRLGTFRDLDEMIYRLLQRLKSEAEGAGLFNMRIADENASEREKNEAGLEFLAGLVGFAASAFSDKLRTHKDLHNVRAYKLCLCINGLQGQRHDMLPAHQEELRTWDGTKLTTELAKRKRLAEEYRRLEFKQLSTEVNGVISVHDPFSEERRFLHEFIDVLEARLTKANRSSPKQVQLDDFDQRMKDDAAAEVIKNVGSNHRKIEAAREYQRKTAQAIKDDDAKGYDEKTEALKQLDRDVEAYIKQLNSSVSVYEE